MQINQGELITTMTSINKGTAVLRNSKRRKSTVVRRLRVLNLHDICSLDKDAMDLLKIVTNPGSGLYIQVCNSFIGFDAKVQRYLMEAVALYYAGEAITYTEFPRVNAVLKRLYKIVDKILDAGK